jgi:NAD+ synthase (glutamine-hydrolysing)
MLRITKTSCRIATGNFNQQAMNFDHNLENLKKGISIAKASGATIFNGPELALSSYSCEDHFLETDTFEHCIESLADILESGITNGIVCAIGCPIMYKNTRYNCVVICLDSKIVWIRPKMFMADDGNYRERRFFTSWKTYDYVQFELPVVLQKITSDKCVPFGFAILKFNDTTLGIELCEELWTPENISTRQFLAGAEIMLNQSASHTQLRKLKNRFDLIQAATTKCGGVYAYSNQIGCDGNRLFFDGSAMLCMNGSILNQASFFSLNVCEIITSTVNLKDVRDHRQGSSSLQEQASTARSVPEIRVDFNVCDLFAESDAFIDPVIPDPREEIIVGPACYLWDYLRKSYTGGFLLPLSGGADSAIVAGIAFMMCKLIILSASNNNSDVINDLNRILNTCGIKLPLNEFADTKVIDHVSAYKLACTSGDLIYCGITPQILCELIIHTVYLGTDFSSVVTKRRSSDLAKTIGSYHVEINIQPAVSTIVQTFVYLIGGRKNPPRFIVEGGTITEDLALQNIQARIRMVFAYLCAQLFPWLRGEKRAPLLVLGSSNVDEGLRGYLTKYDCSSADINPIGTFSKVNLGAALIYLSDTCGLGIMREIVEAPPTAELRPIEGEDKANYTQNDEAEMGFTYQELGNLGFLRKSKRCGPVSMFLKLLSVWKHMEPKDVATKVKNFFKYYAINRHKMTTMTPSYHAESYSQDDNRFDLRPFLINVNWPRQFKTIDDIVRELL